MTLITNEELQKELQKYPKDLPVALAINYNDAMSLFYALKISGIKVRDEKLIIINNEDVDIEYETLMNGADIDEEEIYG